MSIASTRRYLKSLADRKKKSQRWAIALAALQFVDMAKDMVDTVAPYKSRTHLLRDIAQPLRGLINIFRGLGYIALSACYLAVSFILPLASLFTEGSRPAAHAFMKSSAITASRLILGIAFTIRGLTQIAGIFLAWPRILWRGADAVANGWQEFRENAGVKRLVKEAEEIIETLDKQEPKTSGSHEPEENPALQKSVNNLTLNQLNQLKQRKQLNQLNHITLTLCAKAIKAIKLRQPITIDIIKLLAAHHRARIFARSNARAQTESINQPTYEKMLLDVYTAVTEAMGPNQSEVDSPQSKENALKAAATTFFGFFKPASFPPPSFPVQENPRLVRLG